ncbi:MAG: hypothetical protein AMJ69_07985 [Gammaproteobacteria bacterium SG8_47]|nr:MAG: hypothetical protein AMJ69_07985 [Gammaproteobacteria bacterium SG8_47]
MSQSDKTQQKLIDSIRKTKTGAAKAPAPQASTKPTQPAKSAPATKAAAPAKRAPERATPASPSADPYRLGRRVWPD